MSDSIKELWAIRKSRFEEHKHREYQEYIKTKVPQIRLIFKRLIVISLQIQLVRFVKRHWFGKFVCNTNTKDIPGKYLIRFTLNDSNLLPIRKFKTTNREKEKPKKLTEEEELQKAIQESIKVTTNSKYKQKQLTVEEQMKIALQESKDAYLSEEDQLRLAMMASLDSESGINASKNSDECKGNDKSDDESVINVSKTSDECKGNDKSDDESDSESNEGSDNGSEYESDDSDMDYTFDSDSDDEIMVRKKNSKTINSDGERKSVSYSVAFDLRFLINDLDDPIKIYDCIYFLDDKQKERAIKQFKKVEPGSRSGEAFDQDLAYYKAASIDMSKTFINKMIPRMDKGMTQKQLAQRINQKSSVISEYESGKAIPNGRILGQIGKVLGVTLRNSKKSTKSKK